MSGSRHHQIEKQSHRAKLLPFTLIELASGLRRNCSKEVAEHIIYKSENWNNRNIFSLSDRYVLWLIPGTSGDLEGRLWRSSSHYYWDKKAIKAPSSFQAHATPTSGGCTASSSWLQRIVLEFHGSGTPLPTTFPQRLVLGDKTA